MVCAMTSNADRDRMLVEIAALSGRLEMLRADLAAIDRGAPPGVLSQADMVTTVLSDQRAALPLGDRTTAEAPQARRGDSSRAPPSAQIAPSEAEFTTRYAPGEKLGEGGMGEVRLHMDHRIGRAVAMKVLHPNHAQVSKLRERFLFEARVQGQLEHPSIVPVHDLGVRPDGSDFFTMKRVIGRTLQQVLRDLKRRERATTATYSRRRLLAAFQSVCLAAEFAHQRGVIHRDLKPSNVMLGAFGEVSVLDWGVAKLCRTDMTPTPEGAAALSAVQSATAFGEILGTPGYMAPEQAAGGFDVGPSVDVFALGAMLFEILTLNKLIPGTSEKEVREATLRGMYDAHISRHYPDLDVPPELEELCVRATETDARRRLSSARELYDAVEHVLEGEGDIRRRASLARRHTRAAIAAIADATNATDLANAKEARARAIHEVTRAMALDPENQTAGRTMVKILTEMPSTASPAAEGAMKALESESLKKTAQRGTFAYLAVCSNLLFLPWLGIRSWSMVGGACALLVSAALMSLYASRQETAGLRLAIPPLVLASCGFALMSALFGPFVFVPTLCALNTVVIAAGFPRNVRQFAIVCGVAAVLFPILAQLLGWLPPFWIFRDGIIEIVPYAVELPAIPTLVFLSMMSVGMIVIPTVLVGAERDGRVAAEHKLALQAHQLAEFIPAGAKARTATRTH